MKTARVHLQKRSYDIIIAHNQLDELIKRIGQLSLGDRAVVITNRSIKTLFAKKIVRTLNKRISDVGYVIVPDSERSKSIREYTKVSDKVSRLGRNKRIFIIALGGGVVGDLAGFIAATYKRGVPYLQVPTTLLSQVDSAIGGKVAIDLAYAKNLIGSFYQPRLVFSDTALLKTLKKRQMKSGLAEIIKYGMIASSRFLNYLEENFSRILKHEEDVLEYVVWFCSSVKAKIASADEYDNKGKRIILNFGHTIGHALEAAAGYSHLYTHGEAIALGMLAACLIAEKLNVSRSEVYLRLKELLTCVGLPVKIKKVNLNSVIRAQRYDKKFLGIKNRLVLPRNIGRVGVFENVPLKLLKDSIRKLM